MSFLTEIGSAISEAADFMMSDLLLSRTTPGTYDPGTGQRSADAVATFACRGIVTNYTNFDRLNTRIGQTDRRILILQASLKTTPLVDDLVVADGVSHRVLHIDADPAAATWDLQAS